jgi:hypothetical protein
MNRPRLFAELFAGSAALSLALIGGPGVRPPVAYMGGKRRYAPRLLGLLGLHSGQGADALLLCDAGPWGWAWQALLDPESCRAVAATLRGWRGEDPRALWERLAAEPPPVGLVERTATGLFLQARNHGSKPIGSDGSQWIVDGFKSSAANMERRRGDRGLSADQLQSLGAFVRAAREAVGLSLAEVDRRLGFNTACAWWEGRVHTGQVRYRPPAPETWPRLKDVLGLGPTEWDDVLAAPESTWDGRIEVGPDSIARRLDTLASIRFPDSVAVHHGHAEDIDPAEVARWLWLQGRALSAVPLFPSDDGSRWEICERRAGRYDFRKEAVQRGTWSGGHSTGMQSPPSVAARAEGLHRLAWPPTAILHGHAEDLEPSGGLSPEDVIYLDPPYLGRTGYAADCPRERVVELAHRWAEAGATVLVSEAEPLAELDGWDTACLNPSAPVRSQEWVTCSRRMDHGAMLGPLFAGRAVA